MSFGVEADTHPKTLRVVRGMLWAFLAGAVVIAVAILILGTQVTIHTLSSGRVPLNLVALHPLAPATDAGTARIVSGAYETASVTVSQLSPGTVALAITSSIANMLTQAAIALLVALLAWRVLRGRMFRRSLSYAAIIAGGILLVGGMLAQGAGSLATGIAASELNGGSGRGLWPLAGRFDLTFLGVGVVLLLVGLAFEYGERLQRDTEGLV